jgi:hypothetical protein
MMSNTQMIHTYKQYKGSKRPMITTALLLDRKDDGSIRGLAIGFSYCSRKDNPRKKTGNAIASGRAVAAVKAAKAARNLLSREDFENDEDFMSACESVGVSYRTRYGQNKTEVNENKEAYETGHAHYSYLPFPLVGASLNNLAIPSEVNVHKRLVLAINNIEKHDRL